MAISLMAETDSMDGPNDAADDCAFARLAKFLGLNDPNSIALVTQNVVIGRRTPGMASGVGVYRCRVVLSETRVSVAGEHCPQLERKGDTDYFSDKGRDALVIVSFSFQCVIIVRPGVLTLYSGVITPGARECPAPASITGWSACR